MGRGREKLIYIYIRAREQLIYMYIYIQRSPTTAACQQLAYADVC
jgi:hypothetical protein